MTVEGELVCTMACAECGKCRGHIESGYTSICSEVRCQCPRSISTTPTTDPVTRPAHYTYGGIETIDAIEAWELGFHLGNVVKYVSRAGKKDPALTVEDLRKAAWYLDRAIERASTGRSDRYDEPNAPKRTRPPVSGSALR
jgi:hypothetical protein